MELISSRNVAEACRKITDLFLQKGESLVYNDIEYLNVDSVLINILDNSEKLIMPYNENNNYICTILEFLIVFSNFGKNDEERKKLVDMFYPRHYEFDYKNVEIRDGNNLCDYKGENQLLKIYSILKQNLNTTRAVIGLYEPKCYIDTHKPYSQPCQHYWYFIYKDGKLGLNVVLRSLSFNSGFLLINYFEWCCFLEMIAYWLKVPMGEINLYVGRLTINKTILDNFNSNKNVESQYFSDSLFTVDIDNLSYLHDLDLVNKFLQTLDSDDRLEELSSIKDVVSSRFLWHCMQLIYICKLINMKEVAKAKKEYEQLQINSLKYMCKRYFENLGVEQ